MLMLDVRNAITTLLDRYTLADIVEITLRKYRRDKVTPPFLDRALPFAPLISTRASRWVVAREQLRQSRNFQETQEKN